MALSLVVHGAKMLQMRWKGKDEANTGNTTI